MTVDKSLRILAKTRSFALMSMLPGITQEAIVRIENFTWERREMAAKKLSKAEPVTSVVEVYLEECITKGRRGESLFFVQIKGVLLRRTLVVSKALPIEKATRLKETVEDRLHVYKRPKRGRKAKPKGPKTAWQRISESKDDPV